MISFTQFRKENGDIDWKAFKKTQVEIGERCYQYHSEIWQQILQLTSDNNIGRRLCRDCRELTECNTEEVEHQKLIRCSKCEHLSDITQLDCDYSHVYVEGEHKVDCDDCGHEFTISTRVECFFSSPKMGE